MNKSISVAPMMDCTDKHEIYFLSLISKNVHLYTEMIVANAIIRGDRNKLLSYKKISNPVILQVGGSNPSELAASQKRLAESPSLYLLQSKRADVIAVDEKKSSRMGMTL